VPFRKEWVVLDASIHHRQAGWLADLPLVVSHGRLRQLRDDGEWRTKVDLRNFLSSYGMAPMVRVEPLRIFPVIRDLVTALSDFLVKLQSVKRADPQGRATAERGRIPANS